MSLRISEHFTLEEFTRSATAVRLGIPNVPTPEALANLQQRLAPLMEQVRALAGGQRIVILSGYRSPALNAEVKGHVASYHPLGLAADFDPPEGWTHDQLQQAIARDLRIPFDMVLEERALDGAHWLHLQAARPGLAPRRRVVDAELVKLGGPITRVTVS